MAAILDDVGTVLTNANVVGGATGWTLMKSRYDDTTDQAVVLMETAGKTSDQTPGTSHDFPGLQVIVRGEALGYSAARAKVDAVIAALNDIAVSDCVYFFLRQSPIPMGYDSVNRPMISVNFDVMKVRS